MSEAEVTLDQMIAEVKRELAMRRSAYPRFVANHKLAQQDADSQTRRLQAVLAFLKDAPDLLRRIVKAGDRMDNVMVGYHEDGNGPEHPGSRAIVLSETRQARMAARELLKNLQAEKEKSAPQGALDLSSR